MLDNNGIFVPVSIDASHATIQLNKLEGIINNFKQNVNNHLVHISDSFQNVGLKIATFSLDMQGLNTAFSWLKAGLQASIGDFINFGDALDKASSRTGIAVESLSGLKFAAEQCGGNFEVLMDSIKNFSTTVASAANGDVGAINKLGNVGLNPDRLRGLNADSQFKLLAEHIAKIKDPLEQAKVTMELFGDAGYKLLPMLQQGSQGIDDLCNKAESLGLVIDSKTTRSAVELKNSINTLKSSSANLKNALIGTFAPIATSIFNIANCFLSLVAYAKPVLSVIGTFPITVGSLLLAFNSIVPVVGRVIASMKSLGTVMSVIAAHPVILTISVLTAAMVALNEIWDNNLDEAERATNVAAEATRVTENQIDAEEKLLNRLKELSEQDSLTNSEMQETKLILSELENGFGTWGITLDETTGKITGVTDGLKKFHEEALKLQKREKEAELKATENELAKVDDEIDKSTNMWRFDANWTSLAWNPEETEYVKDLRVKQEKLRVKRDKLKLDLNATEYKSSNEENEKKQNLTALTQKNIDDRKEKERENKKNVDDASKDIQNISNEIEMSRLTDYDKNIKQIEEKRNKALSDIETLRKDAVNKGDTKRLEELETQREDVLAWESEQKNKLALEEEQKTREKVQRENEKIQQQTIKRAELEQLGVDNTDKSVLIAQNKVEAIQEKINGKVLHGENFGDDNRNIETLKKELDSAKLELAKTVATVSGKARVQAREEYEKQLQEYNQMKENKTIDNDTLSDKWSTVEKAKSEMEKQDSQYNQSIGLIQSAKEEQARNEIDKTRQSTESLTRGTFNAWEVGSIGNSTAKEQLSTLKKMLTELIEINKKAEEGAVVA